ncbi:MAG: hypothetical protein IJT94_08215 [Oscillibacter sp.]|nr:hypothetical protein [Oscillibacter sp.]
MKAESLPLDTALCDIAASQSDETPRFPWAMIQTYSRLYLGVNPLANRGSSPEDWISFFQNKEQMEQSLLEARFFSDAEEIRLFRLDGGLCAVLTAETDRDRWLEETCEIAKKDKFGSSVTVRRVMDFDEDGQAYVVLTRLSGWKGVE